MSIRPSVRQLIDLLLTGRGEPLEEAIETVTLLLEKSTLHFRSQEAARRAYRKLLPDRLLDVVLTVEEIDAMTDALLPLLDRPQPIAKSAAWALHGSSRLFALPKLSDVLKCWAQVNGHYARQAVMAIWDIAKSVDPRTLTTDEEQVLRKACDALRYARTYAVEDWSDAREAAATALESISKHLDREC